MIFGLGRKSGHMPLNLASSPGFVAAVQLAPAIPGGGRPQLQCLEVFPSSASVSQRLDLAMSLIRLKRLPLRILLEPSEYQFLQAEFPNVPAEELKTAIGWLVKDMLREPLDRVTLDVVPPAGLDSMRRSQGFVVAASNNLVRERMLQFRAYGAEVQVIDIPEMAQRNIADLIEEPGRGTAVLSIGHGGCLLTASREGVLHFTRTFDLSLESLSDSEAARRDQFDRLVLELQRSIDVLDRQFSFLSVSTLWLAPFPHAEELLSLLIENLYLPVKLVALKDLFDVGACEWPSSLDRQAELFHALGLALRDVERRP